MSAARLFPSLKAWLRTSECSRAAALSVSVSYGPVPKTGPGRCLGAEGEDVREFAPLAVFLERGDGDGLLGGVLRFGFGLKPVVEALNGVRPQRECHTRYDTKVGISPAMPRLSAVLVRRPGIAGGRVSRAVVIGIWC
jgi:hypothetical protein